VRLRIGTRGSALALAQTADVARRLAALDHETETVVISTSGDRRTDRPFAEIGSFGVFVREIEAALLDGRIDVAVHSFKDLPSRGTSGLVVAAVPERLDAADVLVASESAIVSGREFIPLAAGARVGTAAVRRQALLRHFRPDIEPRLLRGNVPTRLRALAEGTFDAIILAGAGLARLARADAMQGELLPPLTRVLRLNPARFVPAPSQGAIAVQVRENETRTREAVAAINDERLSRALQAERHALSLAEGGCTLPFGAWCDVDDGGELTLHAVLGASDGSLARSQARGQDPEAVASTAWKELEAAVRAPA
jgi:hydroxymethylbilane synthase